MRRTLAGVSRNGVLQKETRTRAFSSVATGEIAPAKTPAVIAAPGFRNLSGGIEQKRGKGASVHHHTPSSDNCSQQLFVKTVIDVQFNLHFVQPEQLRKSNQFLFADVLEIRLNIIRVFTTVHPEGSIVKTELENELISFKILLHESCISAVRSLALFGSTDKYNDLLRNSTKS